jgi:xylan 1,4-beta-xylosidase
MRKLAVLFVASSAALVLACTWPRTAATPQPGASAPAYGNPVLRGDYPDPSVIRVGRDYWATATTSQWAPIFPLLHSTDLVNWRLTGSVFQSPPSWSAGSYWAPEISQDAGRFFVYYTARRKNGPLCVAVADAAAPQGPYTDRGPLVCQDVGSIDAATVTDENGRRYLVWKEDGNSQKRPTPLWAQPLSANGTALAGEKQEIFRNEAPWEAHLVEGPFILRRADYFYMFYSADACCGRRCNYKTGVARSRKLMGPWERYERNPLLAGNDHWKCPGHGSIVDDPAGRTFFLYHAYHPADFEFVGRQGLLDEVKWGADGWPAINEGRGPSHASLLSAPAAQSRTASPLGDEFNRRTLDPAWQWPWDQQVAPSVEPERGGWLRLRTSSSSHAIAARPTLAGSYVATAVVDASSISAGARAGLAAFGNRENLLAVTVERPTGAPGAADGLRVSVWRAQKGKETPLTDDTLDNLRLVHLQVSATDRERFKFAVSSDGRNWKTLASDTEGDYLPPWDLAVRAALLVTGPDASAAFDAYTLAYSPR